MKLQLLYLFIHISIVIVYSLEDDHDIDVDNELKTKYVKNCYERNKIHKLINQSTNISFSKENNDSPAILINNIIDDIDSYNIIHLSKCVQRFYPSHSYTRLFDEYGGGNNVTFINNLLYTTMPDLYYHIYNISSYLIEYYNWRPNTKQLGVRVVELLEYSIDGQLSWHSDYDSIYTMVIMLSSNDDYNGGTFMILPRYSNYELKETENTDDDIIFINPSQYSAILFDSLADHSVSKILDGKRTVLAIEFWPFSDTNMSHSRPPPDDSLGYLVPSFYIQEPISKYVNKQVTVPDGYILKDNDRLRIEYFCIFLCGIVIGIFYDLLINIYTHNQSKQLRNKLQANANSNTTTDNTTDNEKKKKK